MEYARLTNSDLRKLPIDERIRLVEDLWDSIAQIKASFHLPLINVLNSIVDWMPTMPIAIPAGQPLT